MVVANNVIDNFGQSGIVFSGDSNPAGSALAAIPFGRIINNTIFGGMTAAGIGISVNENAAPSLINNILANTLTESRSTQQARRLSFSPTSIRGTSATCKDYLKA